MASISSRIPWIRTALASVFLSAAAAAAPSVTGFSPTMGSAGAMISINGTGLLETTLVTFNGVTASSFYITSDTLVTAQVPQGATSGLIGVETKSGSAASSRSFTVVAPGTPIITDFNPKEGSPGNYVSISGTNLGSVLMATINGVEADIYYRYSTSLSLRVPAGATSGPISLFTATAASRTDRGFVVLPQPAIYGFTPSHGAAGETITLTGTGLGTATSVSFGGTAATSFTVVSDEVITAVVPAGACSGAVNAVLATPSGSSLYASSLAFFAVDDVEPAVISSFQPTSAAWGRWVTITGSGLKGVSAVRFGGGMQSPVREPCGGSGGGGPGEPGRGLSVEVPWGATTGKLTLVKPNGTFASADEFTVLPLPVITSLSPAAAKAGDTITLEGSNFIGVASVTFVGGRAPSFTIMSDTVLTAVVPETAGNGSIQVANANGVSFSPLFTMQSSIVPTLGTFNPSSGVAGNTIVSLYGSTSLGQVTSVQFGGVEVPFVINQSSRETPYIIAMVPYGATTGRFTVSTAAGSATTTSEFYVTQQPPVVYGCVPPAGRPGDTVTIIGERLSGITQASLSGVTFPVVSLDENRLAFKVPTGASSGLVVLSVSSNGQSGPGAAFTVLSSEAPTITALQPASAAPSARVVLIGSGLESIDKVEFNGVEGVISSRTATMAVVVVPQGATSGPVSVSNSAGSGRSTQSFTVLAGPVIDSFSPTSGAPGTLVTVTGSGLSGTTDVSLGYSSGIPFTLHGDTSLSFAVPQNSTDGIIGIVTAGGGGVFSASSFAVAGSAASQGVLSTLSGAVGSVVKISGVALSNATAVEFNGVSVRIPDSMRYQGNLTVQVPAGATTGPVTLVSYSGRSTLTNSFEVVAAPAVGGFQPASGGPGTLVTITGSGFTTAKAVSFGSGATTTFTIVGDSSLTVMVPTGATSGKVQVITANGTGTSSGSFTVEPLRSPMIVGFLPAAGKAGDLVAVAGSDLISAQTVTIGGVEAPIVGRLETGLRILVPEGATTGPIAVTNALGTGTTLEQFVVLEAPVVGSFSPSEARLGATVVLSGANLTGATAVFFGGGASAVYTVDAEGRIVATVPDNCLAGAIFVTTPAGTSATEGSFQPIVDAPVITDFNPKIGSVGTRVTLTGTSLAQVTQITMNGIRVAQFTRGTGQVSFNIPNATTGRIVVTNYGGTATTAEDFVVVPRPVVSAISPSSGKPGDTVTITGSGLTGATSVMFGWGASQAASFTVFSDTQVTAVVPANATSGGIGVATPGGTSWSQNFTVVAAPPPQIASFSPTSGKAGDAVVITGSNLTGANFVSIGGVAAASFTVDSDLQITAVVSESAITGVIGVQTPSGTAQSLGKFIVLASAPVITSFTPTAGSPGTWVDIAGAHFGTVTSVHFNGVASTSFTSSDTSVHAQVPQSATTGKITVTNAVGTATSAGDFTVALNLPVISMFEPVAGGVGTVVVLNGVNLLNATAVTFNGVACSWSSELDTIWAVVPANATTGRICVTNADGSACTTTDFTVVPAPTIASLSPSSGKVGDSVVITGTALSTATLVRFNGTSASFTVQSDSQLTATVPVGAKSGVVTVITAGGAANSQTSFTVLSAPTLSSFSPTSGVPGTYVSVYGTNLTNVTSVKFNGTTATNFTVYTSSVYVQVPNGATSGPIAITTPGGTATSSSSFIVPQPPMVASFSPASARVGATLTINGANFSDATGVYVGDGHTSNFTRVSDQQIRVTVPSNATNGRIGVVNSAGTGYSQGAFTLIVDPPSISSFYPSAAGVGAYVSIYGSNLSGVTAIAFNGTIATSYTSYGSYLYVQVPSGATTGRITLTGPGGVGTSGSDFTVYYLPVITSFSPISARVGDTLTVTGLHFAGASAAYVGEGYVGSIIYDSDTQIRIVVPANASSGPIRVVNPIGSLTSTASFTLIVDPPTLTDFNPKRGKVGDSVQITGTYLSNTTAVTFNGVSAYFYVSGNSLYATVPQGARTGRIIVTNPGGSATSTVDWTLVPAPVVVGFTPVQGKPGDTITINGLQFTDTSAVYFGGQKASTFEVVSNTLLTAVVPEANYGASGSTSGVITVETPGGVASSAMTFTVLVPPTVSYFAPSSGLENSWVTIYGNGLSTATSVRFNGLEAAALDPNGYSLRAQVPQGATSGPITVTNPIGTATSQTRFTVVHAPVVDGFSPLAGRAGTEVTLTGAHFTGAYTVGFGSGSTHSFTVNSDSSITVAVPANATPGLVYVINAYGTAYSAASFSVLAGAPPTIESFSPTSGPANTSVTVSGTNLWLVTSAKVGSTPAPIVSKSIDSLVLTVPWGSTGGLITLTNSEGSGSSTSEFVVVPPPTVVSFSPASGRAGDTVTVNGTHFTGAKEVAFGGVSASNVSVVSETQLTAVVPQGARTGAIRVTATGGTGYSSTSFTVLASTAPTLSGFYPTAGKAGTTVTVSGTNLGQVSSVRLNGTACGFTTQYAGQLQFTVPYGATTGRITIVNSAGAATSSSDFVVYQPPMVSGFTPASGRPGTSVVLVGSNLSGVQHVAFGGGSASFSVQNDHQLTAVVPDTARPGPIYVSTPGGEAATLDSFLVLATAAPEITGFSPSSAKMGDLVVISGLNLREVLAVTFNGTDAEILEQSSTSLSARVPYGATSGRISALNSLGAGVSATDFVVLQPPTIDSFTPASGGAGDTITLSGSGFTGVGGVVFNGREAVTFEVLSDTSMTAVVPTGASSGRIWLHADAGYAVSRTDFTVLASAAPIVSSFSPTSGGIGMSVQITGANLAAATAVLFNGAEATSLMHEGDAMLYVEVPERATTGTLTVVNSAGATQSTSVFTVLPPPVIDSFEPTSGPVGEQVTLTGQNLAGTQSVEFGNAMAQPVSVSDTLVVVQVPQGATTGPLAVHGASGSVRSTASFTVVATEPPVLTGFSPSRGGALFTQVRIDGENLQAATRVEFNGAEASIVSREPNRLLVTVPTAATTGLITVANAAGEAVSTSEFTVLPPPRISGFTPASGYPGETLTVFGSGFVDVADVYLANPNQSGSERPAHLAFRIVDETLLELTVPAGATTGLVVVVATGGYAFGPTPFVVLDAAAPIISGFTPSSGTAGTTVTVSGANFRSVSAVQFNGVAAASFQTSENALVAVVPPGATTGKIRVVNSAGSAETAEAFTVRAGGPVLTGLQPTSAAPGAVVTLTGTGLSTTRSVAFAGQSGYGPTEYRVLSATELQVVVPEGAANGPISVTTDEGLAVSAPFTVQAIAAPRLESLAPESGPVGTYVMLGGSNLRLATSVKFNGVDSKVIAASETAMLVAVPVGATTGRVTVTNTAGTATSKVDFAVLAAPTVASFTPATGAVGDTVTLTGTGFRGATAVLFGSAAATELTVASDTSIQVLVPAGATCAPLSVVTPGGVGVSAARFTLTAKAPPTLTDFNPKSGKALDTVVITGANLAAVSAVKFNGTDARISSISDTSLLVRVPAGATSGALSVTNASGTATSTAEFTVLMPPVLSSFAPASAAAGATVTLTGSGFTGATLVGFGNGTTSQFTVKSDTSIEAVVPATATTGPVRVVTSGGTVWSSSAFTLLAAAAPTLTSFSPTSGPVGTTITVTGTQLGLVTRVTLNGAAASFSLLSDTRLTVKVAAGATSGKLAVTNSAGTATSEGTFTVVPAPLLTGFSPASGKVGETVTLTGSHLSGITSVAFGSGWTSEVTAVDDEHVTVAVPANAATGAISVQTPGGSATSTASFTVLPEPPTVSELSPLSGKVGDSVTVTGTHLGQVTEVTFNGTRAEIVLRTATSLRARVPAGATSGVVVVKNASGTASAEAPFTVILPPTIASFSPASARVGDTVTLTGAHFTGVQSVRFGATMTSALTVDSDTQLSVAVPAGATTGLLSVENAAGLGWSSSYFTVLASAPPTIVEFSPTSGRVGTTIAVSGTNFSQVTSVTLGGVAVGFAALSDTSLRIGVPSNATTGRLVVTNSAGTATSTADFTVLVAPTLVSFAPASAEVGAQVTLTGTHLAGATRVAFGSVWTSSLTSVSETGLVATVPANATSGQLGVETAGGSAWSPGTFTVLASAQPVVTSFSPESGPVGTRVTVTGSNLRLATRVTLGGTPVSFDVGSDTSLQLYVPSGASTGPIAVTNSKGTVASATAFTVVRAPVVSSFAPASAAEGATVTLTGLYFTGSTRVAFASGATATPTVVSDTQLTVEVPAGAVSGTLSVATAGGTGYSKTPFTVLASAPPAVTGFQPKSGGGGTWVTLSGSNFRLVTSVKLGSVAADFNILSATSLQVRVPAGAATAKFVVANSAGSASSDEDFTFIAPPTVTAFSPESAPVGASVTLTGTHLSGATAVGFAGSAAASSYTVESDTQLSVVVPANAKTGPVMVQTAGGTAYSTASFVVLPAGAPVLASFSPASGKAGDTVTVNGTRLAQVTSAKLSGTTARIVGQTASTLFIQVPAGATTGRIVLTSAAGSVSSATDFTVVAAPAIAGFSPTSGRAGDLVTLTGERFQGATELAFGFGATTDFAVVSDTEIRVAVPVSATPGPIQVTTRGGTGSSTASFTVLALVAPTLLDFTPKMGGVSMPVTLSGLDLAQVTAVTFNGATATVTRQSATSITVTVPSAATSGKIVVTNSAGSFTSALDFTVVPLPLVASFNPGSGYPGDVITVTGSHFTGATDVAFGASSNVDYVVDSDTQITARVPVDATPGAVRVTTAGGTGASTASFVVLATGLPVLTDFTPKGGPVGATVYLTGSNLLQVSAVAFNGTAATINEQTNYRLSVTVPAGATTGAISVTNSQGTVQTATAFAVSPVLPPAPLLVSANPTSAGVGARVVLTGEHFQGTTSVRFDTRPATFIVDSDTQITTSVPDGTPTGVVTLIVTTPGGSDSLASGFTVLLTPAPRIVSFDPKSGFEGTQVTLTGTDLGGVKTVKFNGVPATILSKIVSEASEKLVTRVPAGATTGTISVESPSGTTHSAEPFIVTVAEPEVPEVPEVPDVKEPELPGNPLESCGCDVAGGVPVWLLAFALVPSLRRRRPAARR